MRETFPGRPSATPGTVKPGVRAWLCGCTGLHRAVLCYWAVFFRGARAASTSVLHAGHSGFPPTPYRWVRVWHFAHDPAWSEG